MKSESIILTKRAVRMIAVALMLVAVLPVTSSPDDLSDEQKAVVTELMEVTGAAKIGQMMSQAVIGQMMRTLEATDPEMPDSGLVIVEEEVNGLIAEQMKPGGVYWDIIYPIYYKYLTMEEIKQLVEFYKTPLGRKVTETMPAMVQETMAAAQTWAQSMQGELTQRIISRLLKEGY